ncbi:MAG: hypothetical protein Q9225_001599 [Loekoesia sp. 1 TL-2023]
MLFPRTLKPTLLAATAIGHHNPVCLGRLRTFAAQLPPRLVIPEEDIEESFLKGSGPGGQKINKTSSAVQLKHLPTGMVVKSQATRSRSQNRSIARRLLAEKLEEAEKGSESRAALKLEIKRKKKASKVKKARRKYRARAEDGSQDTAAPDESGLEQKDKAFSEAPQAKT